MIAKLAFLCVAGACGYYVFYLFFSVIFGGYGT